MCKTHIPFISLVTLADVRCCSVYLYTVTKTVAMEYRGCIVVTFPPVNLHSTHSEFSCSIKNVFTPQASLMFCLLVDSVNTGTERICLVKENNFCLFLCFVCFHKTFEYFFVVIIFNSTPTVNYFCFT